MPQFKVIVHPCSLAPLTMKVEGRYKKYQSFVNKLGSDTRDYMRSVIKQKIVRQGSTGKLSGSIKKKTLTVPGSHLVGVGELDYMNTIAPYWYVINYGHKRGSSAPYIPGDGKRVTGFFGRGARPRHGLAGTNIPGGAAHGAQRWHGQEGGFSMQAKNPIAPKRFISITVNWLKSYWKSYAKNIK